VIWLQLYFYLTIPFRFIDSFEFVDTLNIVNFEVLQVGNGDPWLMRIMIIKITMAKGSQMES
jgi:hypothetical protein